LSCAAARRNLSIVFLATGVPATSHSFRMSGQKSGPTHSLVGYAEFLQGDLNGGLWFSSASRSIEGDFTG
jgi:hypothetical protein